MVKMISRWGMGLVVCLFAFTFASARAAEPPVTLPEGWQISEQKQDNVIIWTTAAATGGTLEAIINVFQYENAPHEKVDLSAELDDAVVGFKMTAPTDGTGKVSIACGEKSNLAIGSLQAMTMSCDALGATKLIFVMAQGEKSAFLLTFIALNQASYDKYLPEWRKVLESAKK